MAILKNSTQQRLFYYQLLLNSILILIIELIKNNYTYTWILLINILGLVLPVSNRKKLKLFNQYIQLIAQAAITPTAFSYLITLTKDYVAWTSAPMIFVTLIYATIMYIPYTFVFFKNIHSKFMQIVIILLSFLFTATSALDWMTIDTPLEEVHLIKTLSDTLFLGAIIIAVIILVAMHVWKYDLPKFRFNNQVNKFAMIFLFTYMVWFTAWNSASSGNTFIASLYTFDFSKLHFTISNILSGLEAGIAEEFIFRYAVLTIFLIFLKNSKHKTTFAVIISSLLFGLAHGINIFAGQDLGNTLIQIIFAFGLGAFLSSIYLYTEAFYIPILIHSLLDIFVFAATSSDVMTGKVATSDIIFTIIESLIFVVIAALLINSVSHRQQLTS
ncbi:CPBP family intramembrane glutamic endopeptidase [Companilactobacillus mishanensis]|uniref:CPBP family intramembrane glutamic endopeptidase n=1 Tax=Companilactobacillus mishanensis TaxID=2486008 RepID=UPI0012959E78|nr:CPBP family intramembrane glutamic endopeptidase [Companilactobacillus mishanensis]MQS89431.1 CPBP family intramembrane metalloprotease [Companilactobacillus mishanensis]